MRVPRLRAAASLTALVLLSSACGQAEPAADAADPGIGHIHGLGVDPADNALYVAGHHGLFRISSADKAERVAGRVQDHMGFTVVGPKTFLASGHPGAPRASDPHLGLIRTTDAGRTWVTVSAGGTADFHALQPAGGRLPGQAAAFTAVTAQRLLAATADGAVHESADGGQSFTVTYCPPAT